MEWYNDEPIKKEYCMFGKRSPRRIKLSFIKYIHTIVSSEGEKVGIVKQRAEISEETKRWDQ
jgi:hypothetical protein